MSTVVPQVIEPSADTVAAITVLKKHTLLGDYAQLFKVRVTSLIVMTA